jgi:hypothetical protein
MTERTTRIIYQFSVDLDPIDNGGVWARRKILVQCDDGSQGRQECNIQGADQNYSMDVNAWRKA